MSTATHAGPQAPHPSYLNASWGLKSWLLTLDHKRIGVLYLVGITVFFLLGAFFAALVRIELLTPKGDLVEAETYNRLFTMHGVAMIFFFLIPSIPA
ncbi:MAG: cbb3-type cytochrome c oxidase subunit I, partial [Candidatus Latescibacterota bacterium]